MKHRLSTIYTEFPENLDRMFQTEIRVPFLKAIFDTSFRLSQSFYVQAEQQS